VDHVTPERIWIRSASDKGGAVGSVTVNDTSSGPSMNDAQPQRDGPRRGPLRRWLPLLVLVAAVVAVWASGLTQYLSLASIAEHRDLLKAHVAANVTAALALYMAVYVAAIALSLPGGTLLTVLGGFLFGWLAGGLATVVAATSGATVVFLIARSSFGAVLAEKAGERVNAFAKGFREDAFNYLLFLRLVPLFPFWLVNIAPALFNVRPSTFMLSTIIGIIPATFAFSVLGSGFDSIIAAQRAAYEACLKAKDAGHCHFNLDAGALITPQIIAALVALGVVAIIPVAWKRFRMRKGEKPAASIGQKDNGHADTH